MPELRSTTLQFLRFTAVGGIATGIHYLILIVLVHSANIDAVWASTLGFIISALFNYLLNYRYTFRSSVKHRYAVIKFLLIASVGLLLNSLTIHMLIETADTHYLLAQLIATALVLLWNFSGNRLWTFKPA